MKTIVCYGDSNTWGYSPDDETRFPLDIRWTGRLAHALGDGYRVMEEGLNGRTIATPDVESPWLDGMSYLKPCLLTHLPFELLVIMLGTNDTKHRYGLSAARITENMRGMVQAARAACAPNAPEILLVAPAPLSTESEIDESFTRESAQKAAEMRLLYGQAARDLGCHFLDSWTVISAVGCDNVHLTGENHRALADALCTKIKGILG